MGKILIVDNIVEDAIQNGYNYIEQNELKLGTKYLEYGYSNTAFNNSYLNYALITSYYNLGQYEKVEEYLQELDIDAIDNQAIKDVIIQIQKDVNSFHEQVGEKSSKNNNLSIDNFLYSDAEKDSLVSLLFENYSLVKDHINFDIDIKKIRNKIAIDKEKLKEYGEFRNNILYSFIVDYDLKDLLDTSEYEEIKQKLNTIEENAFFKEESKELLNVCSSFNEFSSKIITDNKYKEAHKIYRNIIKNTDSSFFLYQGLVNNTFDNIFKSSNIDRTFKNEMVYDILTYIKLEKIPNTFESEVYVPLENVSLDKFNNKIEHIKEALSTIDSNEVFIKDSIEIAKDYLKCNLESFEKVKDEELIYNILIYLYYSNYKLSQNLKNKILAKIDITDRANKVRYNEINKITSDDENML